MSDVPAPAPAPSSNRLGIPVNRVVAFIAPRLIYIESAVAAWLVAKVNVLGIPGFDQQNVATWIAAAVTALLTALVTHLAHMKWLNGWIVAEETPVPSVDDIATAEPLAGEDFEGPLVAPDDPAHPANQPEVK